MSLLRFLCMTVCCLYLSACVTGKSYFFPRGSVVQNEDGAFQIVNPKESIVVLWTPGSNHNELAQPCYYAAGAPDLIYDLQDVIIDGKQVIVHGFCSRAVGNLGTGRSMSEARAPELEDFVRKYIEQGVPAKQIFVSGHSMGGWAAVLVGARKKVEIGGFIAFAPANGIWTSDRRTSGHWAAVARQKTAVEDLDRLDGLLFLFESDPYNSPKDLAFMKEIPGIDFRAIPACGRESPHRLYDYYCFKLNHRDDVRKYIEKRVTS
jgi:predicted alpha/beta hydrolase family esterase